MSRRDAGIARWAAFVLTAAVGLAACGSSEPDPAAATPTSGKSKAARSAAAADMVAAVSASKTPGPVDVNFALAARPAVGKPVDLRIALTPNVELERLYARFQPSDGLDLVKGGETGHIERPAVGSNIDHTITVTPKADGIFYVTATVISDSSTGSESRIYSIPIIAGAGLPELPPAAAQATQPPQVAPTTTP
jgi:hypothetical protein